MEIIVISIIVAIITFLISKSMGERNLQSVYHAVIFPVFWVIVLWFTVGTIRNK